MGLPRQIEVWADRSALAVIGTNTDGTVIYWNQAATELYQWSARDAVGRNVLSLTPSMQSKREAQEVMTILRAGKTWCGNIVLRRRDGVPFNAYVADVPLHPAADLILGISAVAKNKSKVLDEAAQLAQLQPLQD